jgi:hypothetical protein
MLHNFSVIGKRCASLNQIDRFIFDLIHVGCHLTLPEQLVRVLRIPRSQTAKRSTPLSTPVMKLPRVRTEAEAIREATRITVTGSEPTAAGGFHNPG